MCRLSRLKGSEREDSNRIQRDFGSEVEPEDLDETLAIVDQTLPHCFERDSVVPYQTGSELSDPLRVMLALLAIEDGNRADAVRLFREAADDLTLNAFPLTRCLSRAGWSSGRSRIASSQDRSRV